MTHRKNFKNDPTTRTAESMARHVSAGLNGPTPIANIAGRECHPGETVAGDIAAMPIVQPRMSNENAQNGQLDSNDLTIGTTKRQLPMTQQVCEHCGETFTARRPWTRFCSSYCRRRAWLDRNPDRAAEILATDRKRLRAHIEARGGVWEERSLPHGT